MIEFPQCFLKFLQASQKNLKALQIFLHQKEQTSTQNIQKKAANRSPQPLLIYARFQ